MTTVCKKILVTLHFERVFCQIQGHSLIQRFIKHPIKSMFVDVLMCVVLVVFTSNLNAVKIARLYQREI